MDHLPWTIQGYPLIVWPDSPPTEGLQIQMPAELSQVLDQFDHTEKTVQSQGNQGAPSRSKYDQLVRSMLDWKKHLNVYDAILLNYGWLPSYHLEDTTIATLIKLYMEQGELARNQIEQLLIRAHTRERLQKIVRGWNFGRKREQILSKCLKAHVQGDFELSVPVFIAQAEGICVDPFDYQGKQRPWKTKKKIKEVYFLEKEDHLFLRFFDQTWCRGFEYGKKAPESNRNAIMHGQDCDYATEKNSLRMILFIDFMEKRLHKTADDV